MSVDEIEGAPRRTGRFWFDFLAASAAIFISVVSLVIGMRGEATQRALLAASSWPFMQADLDSGSTSDVINIVNQGVGPAKVFSFEVFLDRQPVVSTVELLRRCCGLPADEAGTRAAMSRGISLGDLANNVVRPDERRVMIEMHAGETDPAMYKRFSASLNRISYRLCYCSVLNTCWISDLRGLNPREVAVCPLPEHPFATFGE